MIFNNNNEQQRKKELSNKAATGSRKAAQRSVIFTISLLEPIKG